MWKTVLCLISMVLPLSITAQDTLSTKPNKPYHRVYLPPPGESQVLRQWLIQQAQANDAQAQHELCLRYLQGLGFPPDTGMAVFWLQKAVKAKLPAAIYNHGIFSHNGIGLEWNPFEAYRNFQTAAQLGMPEAQYALGILYTDNLVVRQNFDQAAVYLKQAFDQGYIPAGKVLTEMKQRGLIRTDSTESLPDPDSILMDPGREWTSSSVLMDPNLSPDLVDFNRDSLSDSQRDSLVIQLLNRKTGELKTFLGIADTVSIRTSQDSAGLELIQAAARNSNPEALFILGRIYQQGFKTRKNLITSLACYIRAYRLGSPKSAEVLVTILDNATIYDSLQQRIQKGNPEAMFVRAALSALGFDYRLTQNQAMDLLLKAVEKKYPAAAIEAGLCYYTGTLVKKDKSKAYEYWNRAAQFGEQEGRIRIALATILEDSSLALPHRDEIHTLQQAADQGSVLAQASLAYCYRNGIGINRNKGRAAGLYWSAAQRGNDAAYRSLKSMIDEIRPTDPEFLMPE